MFFVVIFTATIVKAQSGYNYTEWGWGVEGGNTLGYTNVQRQYEHGFIALDAVYNYGPYLPIVAELQIGQLSGGGTTANLDPFGRQYSNNYKALVFYADVHLGAAIDYQGSWVLGVLKNFYVGTGFGLIYNDTKVQRTNTIAANGPLTYVFPGKNSSVDPLIPMRVGYEFKIFDDYNEPSMAIDIGYAQNFAFGEGLDGYNDPQSKFKNNASDQYRQILIGFKYFFGNVVSYNKLIRDPR